MAMITNQLRVPPGPTERYSSAEDLFRWMKENFVRYGDIYKASVFGSDVYVVSAPEYCERILRWNWQNYARKGPGRQTYCLATRQWPHREQWRVLGKSAAHDPTRVFQKLD